MIYKARVISNNDFSTTGKIKVRVFKETMPELWKPLTEIPDSIKEATEKLTKVFYEMSEQLYKNANPNGRSLCFFYVWWWN